MKRIKSKMIVGQGQFVLGLAALLFILLTSPGCLSVPSAGRIINPVMTGKPVSLDHILVTVTNLAGTLTAEKQTLADGVVSSLRQTGMFAGVAETNAGFGDVAGVKLSVEITALKLVTDNARDWMGPLAGRARLTVRVTVADLKSSRLIETFTVEGQSGKSAYAGTTNEAIAMAAQQITAEMLKLNAQTAQLEQ